MNGKHRTVKCRVEACTGHLFDLNFQETAQLSSPLEISSPQETAALSAEATSARNRTTVTALLSTLFLCDVSGYANTLLDRIANLQISLQRAYNMSKA